MLLQFAYVTFIGDSITHNDSNVRIFVRIHGIESPTDSDSFLLLLPIYCEVSYIRDASLAPRVSFAEARRVYSIPGEKEA